MTADSYYDPGTRDAIPGDAPPCPDDCEYRTLCTTCGYPLCPEHEPNAVRQCGEPGDWHHEDGCAQEGCHACDLAARDDYLSELGDQLRKGEWDD